MKAPIVDGGSPGPGLWAGLRGYFRALVAGTEPLHRVIISDMLIGGTLINVVAMAAGLGILALGVPTGLWLAVHFAPMPYNLFLVFVVFRTSAMSGGIWTWPARILSLVWLGLVILV